MEKVRVAQLKANLAGYLGRVKAGCSFVITDRDTPVGVLSPVAWMEKVPIRKLKRTLPAYLAEVKAGRSFIVTDNGIPVGVLSSPEIGRAHV